jgi:predicted alpha/beta superfamily hydrolase
MVTGALLAFLPAILAAQAPLEIGKSYSIESRFLNETRVIDVSLPARYETDTARRYPVVVVLDGEFEHEGAAAVTRFYAVMSQLPPLIVVGVRNTDRMRDMTPRPVPGFRVPPEASNAGGADRFLGFLADELMPHLDRNYRTTPMRVLVGHSLGGLFALHALAKRPQAFMGYLVMEPAVWWNNEKDFEAAGVALRQPAAGRARVIMVNTRGWPIDTTRWGGTAPMVRHIAITGETHGSMALAGMMQGLRTMFADFRPTEWRAGMKPIAILDRYDSLAARIGYAVPIPADAYATAIRMSIDARYYQDAAQGLDRMERMLGVTPMSRDLRDKLARDRAAASPGFIPLEIPTRRPTPRDAAAFLGRWVSDGHEVEIKASGDTIIVRDRVQFADGGRYEESDPVIQVTADGTLEWGLQWFRGLAALVVLEGRVQSDGTMLVTREPRGWVPQQQGPDIKGVQRFRRVVAD